MQTDNIRPKTIDGIKSLARSIRKREGVQHAQALDMASIQAGYGNFRHAQARITEIEPGVTMLLTARWRDRPTGTSGTEVLEVGLARLPAGLTPARIRASDRLGGFRLVAPDHLWHDGAIGGGARAARLSIAKAARTLQFMEATGLVPTRSTTRALPGLSLRNRLPGSDHVTMWFDPASRRYLMADEPYCKAIDTRRPDRESWADQHGYATAASEWPGMYWPEGGAALYLVSHRERGVPLEPVLDALARAPAPASETLGTWRSLPFNAIVTSPLDAARPAPSRQPVPKATAPTRPHSLTYGLTFGGQRRRPPAAMPLAQHQEVGRHLKEALSLLSMRAGAQKTINRLRSDLEDWMAAEDKDRSIPDPTFFDVYYHGPNPLLRKPDAAEFTRAITALDKARQLLVAAYPDCTARDDALKLLDKARGSAVGWKL